MANSDTMKFLRDLSEGWQATRTARGHIKLLHTDAVRVVILPGTPSDWCSLRKTRAEMLRALRDGGQHVGSA